jgi:hypothetical protein
MRARTRIDRLSVMDVRAAIRRTRLPFVASLFLATLLGAPIAASTAPATEPAPTPVAAVHSTISTAAEPAVAEPIVAIAATPPVLAAPAVVRPPAPTLRDQAASPALAPRAPPRA